MSIEDIRLLRTLYPNRYKSKKLEEFLPDSPEQVMPVVTQGDVINGYITRYFVRPVNDKTVIYEVDENQHERFKPNPRFVTARIKWKIIGPKESTFTKYGAKVLGVKDINIKTVSEADLTFGGLLYYISDYTQYWQTEDPLLLVTETASPVQILPSPTPTPSPSFVIVPTPTPSATPIVRKTVSVIAFASPTFVSGSTEPVAVTKVEAVEGQFFVGSTAKLSYEIFNSSYEFDNWATTRMEQTIVNFITIKDAQGNEQQIEVPGGIETFQEIDEIISTDKELMLMIPNNDIKIKANFKLV